MKKIIRPTGLIGLLALLGLIAGITWALSGWLLKIAIEEGGSQLLGAKVELQTAKTHFSPLGFTLTGLQVTDPDQPMQNLVEFDTINAELDLERLLMGQIIIDELEAQGMRLNTSRPYSGKLETTPIPEQKPVSEKPGPDSKTLLNLAQQSINVDEIIAREPLKTTAAAQAFETLTQEKQARINASIAKLPSQARLKNYQQQVKQITEGRIQSIDELNQRIDSLKQLKQDLQQDRQTLISLRDEIQQAKTELKQQFKVLKQAPRQDLNMVTQKYSLESGNLGNFAQLLFGNNVKQWLDKLTPWWQQSQQIIQSIDSENDAPPRGKGRYIHFASEQQPLPDFLIRHALLTATLPRGVFTVQMQDITHQPALLGRPMQLSITGQQLVDMQAFSARATLDRTDPKTSIDTATLNVTQLQLSDVMLLKSQQLSLGLAQASSQINADLKVVDGELKGDIKARFEQVDWTGGEKNSRQLMQVLADIHSFNIDSQISGNIRTPKLAIKSDLDKQLNRAMNQQIAKKRAELKAKLTQRLQARVDELAGPYKTQLASLTNEEKTLNQRLADIEKMLQAKVDSAVEAQRQKLKNRLKQEKQRAKDALVKEKQDAKNKLKQKEQRAKEKARQKKQAEKERLERQKQEAADKLRQQAEEKLKNFRF